MTCLLVEPTNFCNLRCTHCLARYSPRPKGFMSLELVEKIVREAPKVRETVLTGGGEPLLHPQVIEFVRKFKKLGNVGLMTNGTLLTQDMADKLKLVGLDWISCSLDGIGPVHELHRVGAKYSEVRDNILYARSIGITSSVIMTITDQTPEEVNSFVTEWRSERIRRRVGVWIPPDRHIRYSDFMEVDDSKSNYRLCPAFKEDLAITWDGRVPICSLDIVLPVDTTVYQLGTIKGALECLNKKRLAWPAKFWQMTERCQLCGARPPHFYKEVI